jgi:hypothetical protein
VRFSFAAKPIRRLERAAARGDPDAVERLQHTRNRLRGPETQKLHAEMAKLSAMAAAMQRLAKTGFTVEEVQKTWGELNTAHNIAVVLTDLREGQGPWWERAYRASLRITAQLVLPLIR